jgi:glutamate/tyrosine decarboxylase-like PLP-dependent enzyme
VSESIGDLRNRVAPLEMSGDEFRELGHQLVDEIAAFLDSMRERPVTTGESPKTIRDLLGKRPMPERGTPAQGLIEETARLLFDHSLFNGHPRYLGYITSPAAPIGALGDLLAAAANPNVGAWQLSPVASAIEEQTVSWIAELLGFPTDCGGLLVSGGNTANFVAFLAARRAKADWDVRAAGMHGEKAGRMRVYCSAETHTWVQKAADQYGLGTDSTRWIPVDQHLRMDTAALRKQIEEDKASGDLPFMVVGTCGSVSTGAIDPLPELAAICREHDLWFHVDGAYGALAAVLPDAPAELKGLGEADSITVDPHKWLYSPLEAGCVMVRDRQTLTDAFNYHPVYYRFDVSPDELPINYMDYGPQNSRGFRALKVWLALQQVGREGYVRMISDDIRLAKELYRLASEHPTLEPFTQDLSITTFRYVPQGLEAGSEDVESYLNELNAELLDRLQLGGEAFVSNAVIGDKFALRACVVNFRTTLEDIEALPGIVTRIGEEVDAELRPESLR